LVRRVGELVLAAVVLLYGGDFVFLRLRSQPTGRVEVHQFYAVRLKGKKVEYMPLENANETCSHSLFPQMGYQPCWYVERHRIRQIDVGN
jgi:hypothetical protein